MRSSLILLLAPCLLAVACGSGRTSGFPDGGSASGSSSGGAGSGSGGNGGSGSGSGSSSGGTFGGDGGSSSGGDAGGCIGAAVDYVYVLSAQNDLYSFAPDKKLFTKIGPLGCKTSLQPNSMAVDRNADAYVNYFDQAGQMPGVLYKVSTRDASCGAQPVVTLNSGWYQVGMGYSTSGTSSNETLYVNGIGNAGGGGGGGGGGGAAGTGLGMIDFTKGMATTIGPFSGNLAGASAELTGTGDGRLFGFFVGQTNYVAQINKTNGATTNPVPMTGLQQPNDWAFSFWGGHFYLYTSQGQGGGGGGGGTGGGSNVTDYDPVTGSINLTYMTSIGFDIVGAGVSTCAPVTMPQ